MKRLSILLLPLLLAACTTKPDKLELTDWQFEYNGQEYPATVPGFIHTDLMANGLISDPYYGTNEDSVRWVGDSVWVYRTHLRYNKLPKGDTLWLVFEGIAGKASLWIGNPYPEDTMSGTIIVPSNIETMDNMFRRYEIPLPGAKQMKKQFVYKDSVPIMIIFEPLDDSVREAEYGITLPERRAFTRIAPYQQGWDWGPKLTTCGIWKPVYITNKRPTIDTIDTINTISKVELRQEQDSIGQSFTFYKDGKPIFVKGANWIPVHSFPVLDSANRARYRHLLVSAKEAGFNMLRVWGGGIYEHDYFYDLCDSLDLMVWQDFIFAGTPYPDSPDMLQSIREEARQQISRIAKHPCVVLWCGNNEVKNGWEDWGWQGVYNWTPEQRARLQHGIDTLFGENGILAQAVKQYDPLQRPYITTSPLYGWGHPECVTHGDSHYWGVWWGEEPFEKYAEKTGRFMSEYGFQSYPLITTIRRFCPDDQLSIDSPTLRNHQKHGRGREIIDRPCCATTASTARPLTSKTIATSASCCRPGASATASSSTSSNLLSAATRRPVAWVPSTGSSTTAGRWPPGPPSTTTATGRPSTTERRPSMPTMLTSRNGSNTTASSPRTAPTPKPGTTTSARLGRATAASWSPSRPHPTSMTSISTPTLTSTAISHTTSSTSKPEKASPLPSFPPTPMPT